jgi:hypothetical protein
MQSGGQNILGSSGFSVVQLSCSLQSTNALAEKSNLAKYGLRGGMVPLDTDGKRIAQ